MSEGEPSASGGPAGVPEPETEVDTEVDAEAEVHTARLGGSLADAYVLADTLGATRDLDEALAASPDGEADDHEADDDDDEADARPAAGIAALVGAGSLAESARPVDPAAHEVGALPTPERSSSRRSGGGSGRARRRRQRAAGALAAGLAMVLGGATMALYLDDGPSEELSTVDPGVTSSTIEVPIPTSGRRVPTVSGSLVPIGSTTSTTSIIGEPTSRPGGRRDRAPTRDRDEEGGGGGGGGRPTTTTRPATTTTRPPTTTTSAAPPTTTTTTTSTTLPEETTTTDTTLP